MGFFFRRPGSRDRKRFCLGSARGGCRDGAGSTTIIISVGAALPKEGGCYGVPACGNRSTTSLWLGVVVLTYQYKPTTGYAVTLNSGDPGWNRIIRRSNVFFREPITYWWRERGFVSKRSESSVGSGGGEKTR